MFHHIVTTALISLVIIHFGGGASIGFFSRQKISCQQFAQGLSSILNERIKPEYNLNAVLNQIRQVDNGLANELGEKFDTDPKIAIANLELATFGQTAIIYGVQAALKDKQTISKLLDLFHDKLYRDQADKVITSEELHKYEQFLNQRYAQYYAAYDRKTGGGPIWNMARETLRIVFGEDILHPVIVMGLGVKWAGHVKAVSDTVKQFSLVCE